MTRRIVTPNSLPRDSSAPLDTLHADYAVLSDIVRTLLRAAKNEQNLEDVLAAIVRDNIDRVIQTSKTGRRLYSELQNSEKTYIGTAVEIDLRSAFGLERGARMDLAINGHDVDVKFSQTLGWMIPPEAIDRVCILVTAREETSLFSVGLIVARSSYLNPGANRDGKRTISASARKNIWWLIRNADYPRNFWLDIDPEVAKRISDGRSGNERITTLFREIQDKKITRKVVEDVARQKDPTRRVRADNSRGSRDVLVMEDVVLLEGSKPNHRALVKALDLPEIKKTEYLAHRFLSPRDKKLARAHGVNL